MSDHSSEHVPARQDDRRGEEVSAAQDMGDLVEEAGEDIVDERLAESYDRLEGILDDYREAAQQSDRASTGLRRRILEIAELEAARGPSVRLRTSSRHEFTIAANTVRAVVRDAVDEFDGLVARRVVLLGGQAAARDDLELRVSFAMRHGMALGAFDEQLSQRIVERLTELVGVGVGRLELVLEDLDEAGGDDDQ